MTITRSNGTVLEAIVLAHDEDEIRAIAPGEEDVLTFTRVLGTWVSEDLEPVVISFAWQHHPAASGPAVDDCICPKERAAYLIRALFSGDEPVEAATDTLFVFDPQGARVCVQQTAFRLS